MWNCKYVANTSCIHNFQVRCFTMIPSMSILYDFDIFWTQENALKLIMKYQNQNILSILKTGGLSKHLFCKCVYYFKNQELRSNNFSKAFAFLKFFIHSTILGLPQGFDEQNCSRIKNSTKELPRLLGFVKFSKFPNGVSRLVNEWNIRIHVPKFRRWLLRNHKWEAWA